MRLRRAALMAVVLAALASGAGAQEITGTITGTVSDQTGKAMPGVAVTVRNVGTGFSKEIVTNAEGAYTALLLPTGRYEATFKLSGFQTATAQGIAVHVNDRIQLDMVLKLGAVAETVYVEAAAQLIQPTPAVQTLMGATQVQELPLNNRNFVQLATLVPGVTSSLPDEVGIGLTSTISISVNGQRRNAVNWLVDGASDVDVGSNVTLLSTPTLESIEEFKIISSSYAAEWPRSGGGIVNVVTKSGTNSFRASAYEFLRNDGLNANSFFRKQTGCKADGTCSDLPADVAMRENPARLRYNNFGFTVGGPIVKDNLFFFFSQEWRKISRAPTSLSANVPDPAWLSDPGNANYVAPALRDANAERLLAAWPAPNLGTTRYIDQAANDQDTRQEVLRVDWLISPRWRLMGRYTHDLSQTTEAGGLFFSTAIPNIATTLTDVPGQVFVSQLTTTIGPRTFNELSFQLSGNAITSEYGSNAKNRREAYGITIPELYLENRNDLIPTVAVSGLSSIGAGQLFDNKYRNTTVTENLTWPLGDKHQMKAGVLAAFEQKNELSTSATQGSFSFVAGGGYTAFQSFLRGNADGACGSGCTYTEPEREIASQFRWQRYEFYVQDSWRVNERLRVDFGVRYSLQPPFVDKNDLLTNFVPARFDPARAPQFNADASRIVVGTGDPLNGIVVAGQTSPYGRGVNQTDKNNFQPRLGFAYDVTGDGKTVLRGGYGIYYDQPLMGIFLQNAFVNPPVNSNPQVVNPQLSNPGAGSSPTAKPVQNLIATSDPFEIPRTQQWNVGVQRQLYARGVVEIGYAGSKGDNLIQPVEINQPQPAGVAALAKDISLNRARPYAGYGTINMRQTTAHNQYHGLLVSFRHDAGRAGLLNIAYTLSRTKTSATNDRDTVDFPQNPLDLEAEYALARTDRTHVFTANYVYELPFFKKSNGLLKATLGGWQVSGITQIWSGPPISRVVNGTTNGSKRGIRVDQIGDPLADLPANVPGGVYWFNPAAFAPPADGQYGNTGRALFRLPGVHQWDITLSKNWYLVEKARVQLRVDFINAFNHTQLTPDNTAATCNVATTATSCAASTGSFGQITGTRAPREIQLGLRFSWN